MILRRLVERAPGRVGFPEGVSLPGEMVAVGGTAGAVGDAVLPVDVPEGITQV